MPAGVPGEVHSGLGTLPIRHFVAWSSGLRQAQVWVRRWKTANANDH